MKGCFRAYLSFNGRLSMSLFIQGPNYHGLKTSRDLFQLWYCACANPESVIALLEARLRQTDHMIKTNHSAWYGALKRIFVCLDEAPKYGSLRLSILILL